tara:strand:- start:445 stop:1071 length:627 start_codon:yes stop_codon:yes gene_type:complete
MPYAVYLNYSPRGISQYASDSKIIKGAIKNGNRNLILKIAQRITESDEAPFLAEYLNENRILVPTPRSAPLIEGALWPTKTICEVFVENGLGQETLTLLNRQIPVPKSSAIYNADVRPSVQRHMDSIRIIPSLVNPASNFTIIDDVLTLGRTTYACAHLLKTAYPLADIKIFVIMRTMGLVDDISRLVQPRNGEIHFNTDSGKTWIPN